MVWRFRAFFRKLRRPFRDPFKTERVSGAAPRLTLSKTLARRGQQCPQRRSDAATVRPYRLRRARVATLRRHDEHGNAGPRGRRAPERTGRPLVQRCAREMTRDRLLAGLQKARSDAAIARVAATDRARRERERALDFTSDISRPDGGSPRLDPTPRLPAGHID